jgi:hypothetical protein
MKPRRAAKVFCQRCGDRCQPSSQGSENARPFRRAAKGNCTTCAVILFFQGDEDHGIGFALPPDFEPEELKLPHVQDQFARILAMGGSELRMEEIDWAKVIAKWNIVSLRRLQ